MAQLPQSQEKTYKKTCDKEVHVLKLYSNHANSALNHCYWHGVQGIPTKISGVQTLQIGVFPLHGGFFRMKISCQLQLQPPKSCKMIIPAAQNPSTIAINSIYVLLFSLSHACSTLSWAKFSCKLLVAAQFLGHKTNPPHIIY